MKLKVFIALLLLLLCYPAKANAIQEFDILTNSTYEAFESGATKVKQIIAIKNNTDFTYTPSYSITLGLKDLKNLKVFNKEGSLPNTLRDLGERGESIEITFPNRIVGMGLKNEFELSYETDEIVEQKGSIWEINIPGLSNPDDFGEYNVSLIIPETFGRPTIVKPHKNLLSGRKYTFNKQDIGKSGIFIIFGDNQTYYLRLSYHISNPKVIPVKTEIALPPQTTYQDTRIKSINPEPLDVYEDQDGNWLAVYNLAPGETKSINAEILVRVYSKPIFEEKEPSEYLAASKYWEVNDPEIKKVAQELKTPRAIYDYVVKTLSYNYQKVSENNVRLGARESLKRKDFAVCLEFTDLFVALARAAGIRARSVEGFAYTQNSKLRPLSLVEDVLHSWPEYYDEPTKTWIMIDPTWGNTTLGMDYFSSLDYDHIAFVVKGKDSIYPIPAGGYKISSKTKDVIVSFANPDDFYDKNKTGVDFMFPSRALSAMPIGAVVEISNKGNLPVRNKKLIVSSDLSPQFQEFYIDKILPYGILKQEIKFAKTPFLTNKTYGVTIQFDGNTLRRDVYVGIFPSGFMIIAGGVLFAGSIALSIIAHKTWSLYFQRRKKQSDLRGKSPRP